MWALVASIRVRALVFGRAKLELSADGVCLTQIGEICPSLHSSENGGPFSGFVAYLRKPAQ
jgi:hypothetical protein